LVWVRGACTCVHVTYAACVFCVCVCAFGCSSLAAASAGVGACVCLLTTTTALLSVCASACVPRCVCVLCVCVCSLSKHEHAVPAVLSAWCADVSCHVGVWCWQRQTCPAQLACLSSCLSLCVCECIQHGERPCAALAWQCALLVVRRLLHQSGLLLVARTSTLFDSSALCSLPACVLHVEAAATAVCSPPVWQPCVPPGALLCWLAGSSVDLLEDCVQGLVAPAAPQPAGGHQGHMCGVCVASLGRLLSEGLSAAPSGCTPCILSLSAACCVSYVSCCCPRAHISCTTLGWPGWWGAGMSSGECDSVPGCFSLWPSACTGRVGSWLQAAVLESGVVCEGGWVGARVCLCGLVAVYGSSQQERRFDVAAGHAPRKAGPTRAAGHAAAHTHAVGLPRCCTDELSMSLCLLCLCLVGQPVHDHDDAHKE
jgi:hypothetical protein